MAPGIPKGPRVPSGRTAGNRLTYTGCNNDGTIKTGQYLGATNVAAGYTQSSTGRMDDGGTHAATTPGRFYGLSQVFQVAPASTEPAFSETTATRSVAESTAADQIIGAPVGATGEAGDTLTYTLTGTDATSFAIDASTGQLKTSAALDYETQDSYTVTVGVSNSQDSNDMDDTMVDDTIEVAITVINEDDEGTVSLTNDDPPRVGTALAASLSDPDGATSGETWQWSSAATAAGTFAGISGATSASYAPVPADVGRFLKATASYEDPQGSGKTAEAVSAGATATAGSANNEPAFADETTSRTVAENTEEARTSATRSAPPTMPATR